MAVSLDYELDWWAQGASTVVGIDEVGRGALAGPVTVGAVALRACDSWPVGLADSKDLTERQRLGLLEAITAFASASAVGHCWPQEIDDLGMTGALNLAAWRAIDQLGQTVDAMIVDGKHDYVSQVPDLLTASSLVPARPGFPVTTVIKGDSLCASVAAASVLAKVARDRLMVDAAGQWPQYGWERNKGYGSAGHLAALREHGLSPHHRASWKIPGAVADHA